MNGDGYFLFQFVQQSKTNSTSPSLLVNRQVPLFPKMAKAVHRIRNQSVSRIGNGIPGINQSLDELPTATGETQSQSIVKLGLAIWQRLDRNRSRKGRARRLASLSDSAWEGGKITSFCQQLFQALARDSPVPSGRFNHRYRAQIAPPLHRRFADAEYLSGLLGREMCH